MASPATPLGGRHKRRQVNKRQPLSRTNTLFGAIKNIVTAPLSWFASTDDFEDTRDNMGKRRRLVAVPTEPVLDDEESAPRTKRMRVHSPPRELQREGAYLEPPSSMFHQPLSIGRSVSTGTQTNDLPSHAVGAPGSYVRSTLSPLRHLSISRTMSTDPPPRPQPQDGGAFQSQRPLSSHQDGDSSMESIHALPSFSAPTAPPFSRNSHSMPRDLSMPYSRPVFRMRTSLTPQPVQIQRERSEPPSVQMLRTRPTFVKPPPLQEEDLTGSTEPAPTLGSFVDSVRKTQSPARQHGSILFGGKAQAEAKPESTRGQRALHELEIYKTPLVPTRLRSSVPQASITGVPDLFKPRRKLVLMKDEQHVSDRKLGRKEVVSPEKNDTKPYAGEGGIKKMLAKRKLELEEEEENRPEEATKGKEEGKGKTIEGELRGSAPVKEVPPPPKDDWYSLASGPSGSKETSSLRVGRAKRNHIARPAARPRTKYSAAFEDDVDDAMVDEEKEMLEEAAKKAPVFNIPAGFSFAKDVKPIDYDTTNAKEPPIKSLPFSLTTVSSVPKSNKPEVPTTTVSQPMASTPATSFFGSTPEKPVSLFGNLPSATAPEKHVPMFGNPPTPSPQPSGESSSKEGIPNFFARSETFVNNIETKTPPLLFGSPSDEPPKPKATPTLAPSTSVFSTKTLPAASGAVQEASSGATSLFGSPVPIKDSTNPLWDGDRATRKEVSLPDSASEPPRAANLFSVAPRADSDSRSEARVVPSISFFGDTSRSAASEASSSSGAAPDTATNVKVEVGGGAKDTFSSGPHLPAPATFFGGKSTSEDKPATSQPPVSVSTDQAPIATAPIAANPAPLDASMSFTASTTDAPKPFSPLFGAAPQPTTVPDKPPNIFGTSSSTPSTSAFSFGKSSSPSLSVEVPKPVVSNGGFSFGEAKSTSPAPFNFGAQDTRETKSSSPAPFTFGASDKETKAGSPAPFGLATPSTPHAAEKTSPFSFGTPSASPIPPMFTFGSGGTATGGAAKPALIDRPITPPKTNDQEFKMEESPTRDVQQDNKPPFGGFAFGNPPTSGSVLFGGPVSAPPATTAPFPFSSGPSNPFAPQPIKESKSEGVKPFSFGQSSTPSPSTGFSFGPAQTATDSPRPSTTGSFNVTGPGTPTSTTSGFNFGQPAANPFGQSSGGSAPSSPSTFQPSAFGFGASSGGAFSFGSQPASPATGNTNLPPAATPVTFGGTGTGFGSAPSSPFSAPSQIAPSTSSGGTLFTIGAAPPPPTGGQSRVIKKLPNRSRAKR